MRERWVVWGWLICKYWAKRELSKLVRRRLVSMHTFSILPYSRFNSSIYLFLSSPCNRPCSRQRVILEIEQTMARRGRLQRVARRRLRFRGAARMTLFDAERRSTHLVPQRLSSRRVVAPPKTARIAFAYTVAPIAKSHYIILKKNATLSATLDSTKIHARRRR